MNKILSVLQTLWGIAFIVIISYQYNANEHIEIPSFIGSIGIIVFQICIQKAEKNLPEEKRIKPFYKKIKEWIDKKFNS